MMAIGLKQGQGDTKVCFPAVGAAYRLVVDRLQETTYTGGGNAQATAGETTQKL